MVRMLLVGARNVAVFSLIALPAGIATATVLGAPPEVWAWSLGEKLAAFFYVWAAALVPFGAGFVAHQVGMLIIANTSHRIGSRTIVFSSAPLLFWWFVIRGWPSISPSPLEEPVRVIVPFVVGTTLYCLLARPLGLKSPPTPVL